jgi:hypothetical protein
MDIEDRLVASLIGALEEAMESPEGPEAYMRRVATESEEKGKKGQAQMEEFTDLSREECEQFEEIAMPVAAALVHSRFGTMILDTMGFVGAAEPITVLRIALATTAWEGYRAAQREMAETPNLDLSGLELDPTKKG